VIRDDAGGLVTDGARLVFRVDGGYGQLAAGSISEISVSGYLDSRICGHGSAFSDSGLDSHRVAVGDAAVYACFYQRSILEEFDLDGRKTGERDPSFFLWGLVYDIALDADGHLWYAAPTAHYVGKVNIDTGAEIVGIGGTWDPSEQDKSPFDHPESVAVFGDYLYVADMGNQRISRLHIPTNSLDLDYVRFPRDYRTWEYCRVGDREFVGVTSDQQRGGRIYEVFPGARHNSPL